MDNDDSDDFNNELILFALAFEESILVFNIKVTLRKTWENSFTLSLCYIVALLSKSNALSASGLHTPWGVYFEGSLLPSPFAPPSPSSQNTYIHLLITIKNL